MTTLPAAKNAAARLLRSAELTETSEHRVNYLCTLDSSDEQAERFCATTCHAAITASAATATIDPTGMLLEQTRLQRRLRR